MIVYKQIKLYIYTRLGKYSLVLIHSNMKYFIFAFINNKNEIYTKSTFFHIFKG